MMPLLGNAVGSDSIEYLDYVDMVLSSSFQIFLFFLALKGEKDCITKQRTENNPLSERPPNITSQQGMKP
jgi:hypothetical protein